MDRNNSLDDTMGVMFIGAFFDAILYGIVLFQLYKYLETRNDSLQMKMLISLLFLLDTLQLIFIAHALYYFLITNFSDPVILERSVWSLNLEVGTTVVITFIVRCFFTSRLWALSNKNKLLAIAISILSLAQLGLGIGMCVITFLVMEFDALPRYLLELSLQLSCAVLADIITTAALVYYLNNSRTGIRSTDSMINRLIVWTINTALITGIIEILVLITWVSMTDRLVFIAFHLVVGKLYTNSLLAMLNGREKLAARDATIETSSVVMASRVHPFQATDSFDGPESPSQIIKTMPSDITTHRRQNVTSWSEMSVDKDVDSLRFAPMESIHYAEVVED